MTKQSNKNWFLWRGIATLVLIGLLVAGSYVIYRTGWSQGHAAGQVADEGEETVPPSPFYAPRPWGFAPYHLGAGALLRGLLLIIFLSVIGKLMRFIIWGSVWRFAPTGPWPRPWHAARYHRRHGPVPPGHWPWGQPPEEPETGSEV